MNRQEEIINTIKVLRKEVKVLTERTRDRGTGHLHTTIGVITSRIDELIEEVTAPYFEDEDVYDGFEEHTKAMESARLREIQDKAAGRSTPTLEQVIDDYEHTKEYYDTQRNRPMEGEELSGLSNRSMKQRYGQAVQTVSEMMQDELEPLPINTFK
jgi:hypothetical protein